MPYREHDWNPPQILSSWATGEYEYYRPRVPGTGNAAWVPKDMGLHVILQEAWPKSLRLGVGYRTRWPQIKAWAVVELAMFLLTKPELKSPKAWKTTLELIFDDPDEATRRAEAKLAMLLLAR